MRHITSYKGLTIAQTEEFRARVAPVVRRLNEIGKILEEQNRDFTMSFEAWEALVDEEDYLKEKHFDLKMEIRDQASKNRWSEMGLTRPF